MPQLVDFRELTKIAYMLRLDVLEMVMRGKSGHIGGDFSCMDILVSLFLGVMDIHKQKDTSPDRDRFILSKGDRGEALYAVLAEAGVLSPKVLASYGRFGTKLAGHPAKGLPGIEFATGALGHGLPVGAGMALALKNDGVPPHVYVLLGDGELAEGSVWEAALFSAKYQLDNLTAIVDRNRLQISGSTEDVMPLDDLPAKFQAFGLDAIECDGPGRDDVLTRDDGRRQGCDEGLCRRGRVHGRTGAGERWRSLLPCAAPAGTDALYL